MNEKIDFSKMTTETRNEATTNLDELSIKQALEVMNSEDAKVAKAISEKIDCLVPIVEAIVSSFQNGGRLIYIGAGTSGRLGVLDAVECVPTFGTEPQMVQGLIAGGEKAFVKAVEGAEDDYDLAGSDLKSINLNSNDIVVGIAASGRTPYVIGGLDYAKQIGAASASIACNTDCAVSKHADNFIEVDLGPEVLTGSTRLKSGTAQKLILNMLSTISMVQIGKVFGNLMVDVKATNEKLVQRSIHIIELATNCSNDLAAKAYELAGNNVKVAIVMIMLSLNASEAKEALKRSNGFIRRAIKE